MQSKFIQTPKTNTQSTATRPKLIKPLHHLKSTKSPYKRSLILLTLITLFTSLLPTQTIGKDDVPPKKIYTFPNLDQPNPIMIPLIAPILILEDKGKQVVKFNAFPFAGDAGHYIDPKGRDFMAHFSMSRQLVKATEVMGSTFEFRGAFRRYMGYVSYTTFSERIKSGFTEVALKEYLGGYLLAYDNAFLVHVGGGWQSSDIKGSEEGGPKLFMMVDYFDKPYHIAMKSGYTLNINLVDFAISTSYLMRNLEASIGYRAIITPQDLFHGPEIKFSLWL